MTSDPSKFLHRNGTKIATVELLTFMLKRVCDDAENLMDVHAVAAPILIGRLISHPPATPINARAGAKQLVRDDSDSRTLVLLLDLVRSVMHIIHHCPAELELLANKDDEIALQRHVCATSFVVRRQMVYHQPDSSQLQISALADVRRISKGTPPGSLTLVNKAQFVDDLQAAPKPAAFPSQLQSGESSALTRRRKSCVQRLFRAFAGRTAECSASPPSPQIPSISRDKTPCGAKPAIALFS